MNYLFENNLKIHNNIGLRSTEEHEVPRIELILKIQFMNNPVLDFTLDRLASTISSPICIMGNMDESDHRILDDNL